MELKTDGTGRQMNFFSSAGHARRVHDSEEQFELVNVHLPSPNTPGHADVEGRDAVSQLWFFNLKLFQYRQDSSSDFAATRTNWSSGAQTHGGNSTKNERRCGARG